MVLTNVVMRYPTASLGLLLWLGMLAISFYNFQPLLVGRMITELNFSEMEAGLVASANLLGVGVSLILFSLKSRLNSNKNLLVIAMLLMGLGNLASVYTVDFNSLFAARFMAGVGEGMLAAIVTSSIVFFRSPDRIYALMMVGMSLYGGIGYFLLPLIFASYGIAGAFAVMAGLCIASLVFLPLLPEGKKTQAQDAFKLSPLLLKPKVILVFLSIALVYLATTAIWSYYERIGAAIGITLEDIGITLSLALLASLVGGGCAAVLSDKVGRILPISVGLLLAASSMLVLYSADHLIPYAISIMLLLGATGFVLPYYMGELATLDNSGRLTVIGLIACNVGNVFGSTASALLVEANSYENLISFSGAIFVMGLWMSLVSFKNKKDQSENAGESEMV